ncbi:unnamed protein product [Gadus morhua 'NCC']
MPRSDAATEEKPGGTVCVSFCSVHRVAEPLPLLSLLLLKLLPSDALPPVWTRCAPLTRCYRSRDLLPHLMRCCRFRVLLPLLTHCS